MLSEIKIKNFRCFDDCTFGQFKRINLIGGKNNAGKTTLLEALFVGLAPSISTIQQIKHFRGESDDTAKKYPEKTWENFFFNLQKDTLIQYDLQFTNGADQKIAIDCHDDINLLQSNNATDSDFLQLSDDLTKVSKSTISLSVYKKDTKETSLILEANNTGIAVIESISENNSATYIHSRVFFTPEHLAKLFDTAFKKHSEHLFNAFRVIDSTIVDVRVFHTGDPIIQIKRKDGVWLPLSYCGDAMYKMSSIVLKLLNAKQGGVLLIDEVENGLHFMSQKSYWTFLFGLAKRFDIQVFATSHSLEMISAFNEAALETEWRNEAMYFEMARFFKTNEIIANPMDMEMLQYELKTQSAFRGE